MNGCTSPRVPAIMMHIASFGTGGRSSSISCSIRETQEVGWLTQRGSVDSADVNMRPGGDAADEGSRNPRTTL